MYGEEQLLSKLKSTTGGGALTPTGTTTSISHPCFLSFYFFFTVRECEREPILRGNGCRSECDDVNI